MASQNVGRLKRNFQPAIPIQLQMEDRPRTVSVRAALYKVHCLVDKGTPAFLIISCISSSTRCFSRKLWVLRVPKARPHNGWGAMLRARTCQVQPCDLGKAWSLLEACIHLYNGTDDSCNKTVCQGCDTAWVGASSAPSD